MKNCFVIMPFGAPFDQYYSDIIKPALSGINVKAIRGDEVYSTGAIIEDIVQQIVDSDIVLADVSNKNPNVNYELGMAHALRKQVVIISQSVNDIPFDYKHIRSIIYDTTNPNLLAFLTKALRQTVNGVFRSSKIFSIKALDKYYEEITLERHLGLQNIFNTRQSMNVFLDSLWKGQVKHLDIAAFGLKSFRDRRTSDVINKVKKGLKIRILVLNPDSEFIKQREIDEKQVESSIQKTIYDLKKWKDDINLQANSVDAVTLKYYSSLPLDFYWRQDDSIFIGPYLYGIDSQQTLTLHFERNSEIGQFYENYYTSLWIDEAFSNPA